MGALVSSTTTVHPFDYEPNNWSRFWCCSSTISKSKSVAVQTHAYGLMFEKVDHVNLEHLENISKKIVKLQRFCTIQLNDVVI